jgi:hypothetical protein
MKVIVSKVDLENALASVSFSMGSGNGDLTTHYLFRQPAGGVTNRLEVLTHSGKTFSQTTLVAEISDIKENDSVTLLDNQTRVAAFSVEGKVFKTWLQSLDDCVLEIEFDGSTKVVTFKTPRGVQDSRSLSPIHFPFWDDVLSAAKETANVPVQRLVSAIEYSRLFNSADENRHPELCISESARGRLFSTDKIVISMLEIQGLEKCTLKVHTKNAGSLLSFLNTQKDSSVSILEHPRCTMYQLDGMTIYGETRSQSEFPRIDPLPDMDDMFWDVNVSEIKKGVSFLSLWAEEGDNRLTINRDESTGKIVLSMKNKSGKLRTYEVPCQESGANTEKVLPSNGFAISYPLMLKVLNAYKQEVIRFGLNIHERGGYIRFKQTRFADAATNSSGDVYLTIMAWLR